MRFTHWSEAFACSTMFTALLAVVALVVVSIMAI